MRRTILALLTVFTVTVFAQEKPLVTEAILKIRKNDVVEAKKNIDEASAIIDQKGEGAVDPKTMSKFLFNKGLIYQRILLSTDENIKALAPDALDIATDSYIKCIEYEEKTGKKRHSDDAAMQIYPLAQSYNIRAFDRNEAEDYDGAAKDFLKTVELKQNKALGANAQFDSTSYYYAGLTYMAGKDYESASKILIEMIEGGYNGYTFSATNVATQEKVRFGSKEQMEKQVKIGMVTDPERSESVRPDIYKSLLQCLQLTENDEEFNKFLQMARNEFPGDKAFIDIELQKYLDKEDYDSALGILATAIEKNPDNALYYYIQGFIYQTNVMDGDKALESYAKAVEIDDQNFDSWFMSGVVWYDRGKATIDQMNELGLSKADQKKYDQLKVVKEGYFKKSLPFFEKAYEINDSDPETIKALWEVYRQTGDYEKVKVMKDKMDAMTAPAEPEE